MFNRQRVAGLLGLLLVVIVVGVLAPHFWQVGRAIGPVCSIGLNGTAASVTVRGWTAPVACQTITQRLAAATHGVSAALLVPRPAEDPAVTVVCQGVVAHDHVTIHDGGTLKLAGNLLCAALAHGTPQ